MTITFNTLDFLNLSEESKLDVISFCLRILGNEVNNVIIDGKIIKTRDDLFNWQMDNEVVFPNRNS